MEAPVAMLRVCKGIFLGLVLLISSPLISMEMTEDYIHEEISRLKGELKTKEAARERIKQLNQRAAINKEISEIKKSMRYFSGELRKISQQQNTSYSPIEQTSSISESKQEEKQEEQPIYNWVPSLNFTYNGKVAIDREEKFDSNQMLNWHKEQVPDLTIAYACLQKTPRRIVSKMMVSIIYSYNREQNVLNIPLEPIFINGFKKNDTHIGQNEVAHLFENNEEIDCSNKQYNIIAFGDIALQEEDVIYLGNDIKNNLEIINNLHDEEQIKEKSIDFLKKNIHSERTALIYLYHNINNIMSNDIKKLEEMGAVIEGVVFNLVTTRDTCEECAKLTSPDSEIGKFFTVSLKEKFKDLFTNHGIKVLNIDNIDFFVLTSGISAVNIGTKNDRNMSRRLGNFQECSATEVINISPNSHTRIFHAATPYVLRNKLQKSKSRINRGQIIYDKYILELPECFK